MRVSGTLATRLPPYQLVGEASLLENLQSPGGDLQQVSSPYSALGHQHPHLNPDH